jgi:plasmid maintenance system killer protein
MSRHSDLLNASRELWRPLCGEGAPDPKGQDGIRINDQYRICFAWRDGDAYNVEIAGYH